MSGVPSLAFIIETDIVDFIKDGFSAEVARDLGGVQLVLAIHEHLGNSYDFFARGVLANDLSGTRSRHVNVPELDLFIRDSLNGLQSLPLDRESLAVAAGRVNEGNDPDVLLVPQDSILESIGIKLDRLSAVDGTSGWPIGAPGRGARSVATVAAGQTVATMTISALTIAAIATGGTVATVASSAT